MKLIISRHGESETMSMTGKDRDRKLTETGISEISMMAKFIRASFLKPKCIIHSPYLRTTETAEIYAKGLSLENNFFSSDSLAPDSEYEKIFPELEAFDNSDTILLVGHNPNVSYFAATLIENPNLSRSFQFATGATLALNIPKETFRRGQILWMISPDLLKAN